MRCKVFVPQWALHLSFKGLGSIVRSGLHLNRVVSVPELRQPEAPHGLERVDAVKEGAVVAVRPELGRLSC